ncbi:MAG: hypothetical protein JO262_19560, partial [Solirubrobacterales bacterium]|nr:hypothetical protein [Solirubrobacterales bacterium]
MAALALAGAPAAGAVSGGTANGSGVPSPGAGASGGAGVGAQPPAPAPPLPASPLPTSPVPSIHPTVPGVTAKIVNGLAYAPADAPIQVQRAIWAGDRIRFKPYVYAGGHAKWNDIG